MPTRLDIRTSLRLRLEDTGADPLWDDALLNMAIWNAMVRFGARIPLEASLAVPIPAGTKIVPVTPDLIRERILRVLDASGEPVPEAAAAHAAGPGERTAWRWWNGWLYLNRALAAAAEWSIEYRAVRAMPGNDTDPVSLQEEDVPIIVALAAEMVLRRRAIEEAKRNGNPAAALALADGFAAEASDLFRSRTRTVRSGVLSGVC